MSRTYILYAVNELHLSAATIGIAFAIGNIGTLVGAVLANRLAGWVGVGPTIIGSMFIGSFVGVLVALAPPGDAAVPFIIAAGVIGGVSRMIYNINQVSFRHHGTIWVAAVLFFFPAIFPLLSPVRTLRTMPAQVVDDDMAAAAPAA